MREFESKNPDVRVTGAVIHGFLDAFGPYRGRGEKVVARHCGVSQVDTNPDTRYSMQGFLDAMRELSDQFGASFMGRVGQTMYERVAFPPNIESLDQLLPMLDTAYHMNHEHHGDQIGHYAWEPQTEARGVLICDNPYPCSFDLGLLIASSRRFASSAQVTHMDGSCRAKGDDRCCYTVEW